MTSRIKELEKGRDKLRKTIFELQDKNKSLEANLKKLKTNIKRKNSILRTRITVVDKLRNELDNYKHEQAKLTFLCNEKDNRIIELKESNKKDYEVIEGQEHAIECLTKDNQTLEKNLAKREKIICNMAEDIFGSE